MSRAGEVVNVVGGLLKSPRFLVEVPEVSNNGLTSEHPENTAVADICDIHFRIKIDGAVDTVGVVLEDSPGTNSKCVGNGYVSFTG